MGILREASHDSGTWSEWELGQYIADESGGFKWNSGGGVADIFVTDGNHHIIGTLPDAQGGNDQAVRLFCRRDTDGETLPETIYMSAWCYLPKLLRRQINVVGAYIAFPFQMKANPRSGSGDSQPQCSWNLSTRTIDGVEQQVWHLYKKVGGAGSLAPADINDRILPIGEWFHVEWMYRFSPLLGEIVVWIDGEQKLSYIGPTCPAGGIDSWIPYPSLYLRSNAIEGGVAEAWWDNVVFSTERIGAVNKPGEVTPPPSDVEARLTAAEESIESISTEIVKMASAIELIEDVLDELQDRADRHEQRIDSLNDRLLTVESKLSGIHNVTE